MAVAVVNMGNVSIAANTVEISLQDAGSFAPDTFVQITPLLNSSFASQTAEGRSGSLRVSADSLCATHCPASVRQRI